MTMLKHLTLKKGFSLIELMVAISLIVLVLGAILGLNIASLQQAVNTTNQSQATDLANEAIEAVRGIRESADTDNITLADGTKTNWAALLQTSMTSPTLFALTFNPETSKWSLDATSANYKIDSGKATFERKITICDDPYPSPDCISNGPANPTIKLVQVDVSWGKNFAKSTTLKSHIGPKGTAIKYGAGQTVNQQVQIEFFTKPNAKQLNDGQIQFDYDTNVCPTNALVAYRDPKVEFENHYADLGTQSCQANGNRISVTATVGIPGLVYCGDYNFSLQATSSNGDTAISENDKLKVNKKCTDR